MNPRLGFEVMGLAVGFANPAILQALTMERLVAMGQTRTGLQRGRP